MCRRGTCWCFEALEMHKYYWIRPSFDWRRWINQLWFQFWDVQWLGQLQWSSIQQQNITLNVSTFRCQVVLFPLLCIQQIECVCGWYTSLYCVLLRVQVHVIDQGYIERSGIGHVNEEHSDARLKMNESTSELKWPRLRNKWHYQDKWNSNKMNLHTSFLEQWAYARRYGDPSWETESTLLPISRCHKSALLKKTCWLEFRDI